MSIQIESKLPNVGTTIFTIMSALAEQHNAINLSQGFPNFSAPAELQGLITEFMRLDYNQYAPMPGVLRLRENLAAKAHSLYSIVLDPNTEITITAGGTHALYTAITAFVKTGDEVILIEPAYDCYAPAIELCGGKVVSYELTGPDYRVDWDAFANLITPRTRMIIINTPHNPTSKAFSHEDMLALQRLTSETNIIVISDEVYEHLIYNGIPHRSIMLYPELWKRSLAIYSFGKTFHATGWKMGYCLSPEYLMKEFRKVHQFNIFSVNHPMQQAIATYLEEPKHYLSLPDFYQQKRDFFLEVTKGSRLKPVACEGSYFQLFDYSAISNEADTEFAKRMTIEYGVAVIPVSVFYSSGRDDKMIRICFAKTEETLAKAGAILKQI